MGRIDLLPLPLLTALALYVLAIGSRLLPQRVRQWHFVPFAGGLFSTTLILYQIYEDAGRMPCQTLYESLLFFSWCTAVTGLGFSLVYRIGSLLPITSMGAVLPLLYATLHLDVDIARSPPALQSVWFVPHVVAYFFAYGILALSALSAAICSLGRGSDSILTFSRSTLFGGFVLLTLGLVTGALWGKEAWGDYWNWDPKENWALITWLVYLTLIHIRSLPGWERERLLWLNLLAFAMVLFTYLGVGLLPTAEDSLHTYRALD